MTIQWTKGLNTNIRSIDLQHQELVSLINQLETLHLAGRNTKALDEVLPQLHTYVLFHFREEEDLMVMLVGNEEMDQLHLAQHREFIDHMHTLQQRRNPNNEADTAQTLVHYLKNWLLEHIATTDRDLGQKLLVQHTAFAER